MPNDIISDAVDEQELRDIYNQIKLCNTNFDYTDLDIIFGVALLDRERFPNIRLTGDDSVKVYLTRWVNDYCNAYNKPPSSRTATSKSACSDPAIRQIVKMTQKISEEEMLEKERWHNLFMSAENIQGNLLEEYIAKSTRSYGWIWCRGNTLRAIDFCNSDGSVLLQIKNKSNSENSSSSTIREGTSIKKWYRLGTHSKGGLKKPDYKWEMLNNIINKYRTQGHEFQPCNMNETEYMQFLSTAAANNPSMITDSSRAALTLRG